MENTALRRFIAVTLMAYVVGIGVPVQAEDDNMCVMCHGNTDLWEGETAHLLVTPEHLANDVHWQKGLRCVDCHGGNPESFELREAHAVEDGFRKINSPADIPKFCGHCHSDKEYMQKKNPEAKVGHAAEFWESVHGKFLQAHPQDKKAASCISCHPVHKTRQVSDPESAVNPLNLTATCGSCHENQSKSVLASVHSKAVAVDGQSEKAALGCTGCHGDDVHGMRPVTDMSSPVFVKNQVQSCGRCHEKDLKEYLDSVHGHGLERSGLLTTAICSSCHGAHRVLPAEDENSKLHVTKVAKTCAKCHRFIEQELNQSVHGGDEAPGSATKKAAPGGDVKRKPSCTDCHQGHDLPHPGSAAFRLTNLDRCGNCHAELKQTFSMSMHGQLSELGYDAAADCADCHGAHDILPIANEKSRMSVANRAETCRKCHPTAPANFVSFDPHANHLDAERSPLLHGIYLVLLTFLFSTFGIFGLHSIVWFVRSLLELRHEGRPHRMKPGTAAFRRFKPFHQIAHAIMVVSFLGLAATGLPLKYSQQPWAHTVSNMLGGFESTGLWHRIFGILNILCLVAYAIRIAIRFDGGRKKGLGWKDSVFGPDSPVPNRRDFNDVLAVLKWFIGRGPKPTFERWAYWEKFDFWGACADIVLIGGTGLVLWFPSHFCQFLPGESLNIAKVVHSTQALLATGFVFAIHFFNTHLKAEKFPMDMSILTGLVTEEEFKEERPDYYERMREADALDELRTEVPERRVLWSIMFAGYLAMAIGLALLVGMLMAYF